MLALRRNTADLRGRLEIIRMSAIKSGDLVYCARDCCGEYVGTTFTVRETFSLGLSTGRCGRCRTEHPGPYAATGLSVRSGMATFLPLEWLRKIEPPAKTERVERGEEVTCQS